MAEQVQTPTEDTPYIDKVYSALRDNLKGFNKTPEQFKSAMQDSEYAAKAYTALHDNLTGFDKTPDAFYQSVGVKKKGSTTASQPIGQPLQYGGQLDQSSLIGNGQSVDRQTLFAPITDQKTIDDNIRRQAQQNPLISNAKAIGEQNKQQAPQEPSPDRGFLDKIQQGLYMPALNQGFNDLVVKPLAGGTDFIDRTMDKVYSGITGEKTPDWLRKKGAFDKVANYYDKAYQERDKPTNIVSETAEGVVGALPLMASLATGQGEATLATKAPQFVSNLTKLLATTKAATAFKEATDSHKDYISSLNDAATGGIKGGVEGLTMEAQMMLGGALGKGVANKIAEKGLLKGGKAAEAILHAIGVGTVFAGTPAAVDLLNGKDIDTHEAMKQFGMGLAFELPGVVKGIHGEVSDAVSNNKVNKGALQVASVSNAASNLHSESVIRTLMETPPEQILGIDENIKDGHEKLYANSIEKGVKAYEAKDPDEKRQLYAQQLLLKTQGDVKFLADKVSKEPASVLETIEESDLTDVQKDDIRNKVVSLADRNKPTPNEEPPAQVPLSETPPQDEPSNIPAADTKPAEIAPEQTKLSQLESKGLTFPVFEGLGMKNDHPDYTLKSITAAMPKIDKLIEEEPTEQGKEILRRDKQKLQDYYEQGIELAKKQSENNNLPLNKTENGQINEKGSSQESSESREEKSGEDANGKESNVGNEERQELLNKSGEAQAEPVIKKEEESTAKDGQVKKTILTQRAYEGDIQEDVKKHLEEKGLTRDTFSQEERSKQAKDFIDKFGDESAYEAVKNRDVEGGMAASILAQLQIKKNAELTEYPQGSEERAAISKQLADYIDLTEKRGYSGGEFNGQLAYEYQNQELNYANVKKQVEKLTGKSLTGEQEKRINHLVGENERLKKQVDEVEAKLIEETDKAFNGGKDTVKNETKAQKAKRIADALRKKKVLRPDVFNSANPAAIVWDGAVETVASAIEAGGKIADAIESGLNHIKESDWYKGLTDEKKNHAESEFRQFNQENASTSDLKGLQERFINKTDNKFTESEAKDIWGYMKDTYLENGVDFRDAMSNTSRDLGLSWRQVSEAIVTPKTRRITDEMWKKQSDYRRNRTVVKDWIRDQDSTVPKWLKKISGGFRGLQVFGHGAIFVGTHSGMTLFDLPTASKSVKAFLNGYKFAYGNEGKYEAAMEQLRNDPNYVIAQRAGLKNNPDRINNEEFQKSQKFLGRFGLAGERGFNAIKVLRQEKFNYDYSRLSESEKADPEVLKTIARLTNLATGATDINIPEWVNEVTFAGGMEASRWQRLVQNPLKFGNVAVKAILHPKDVTASEKVFAKVWAQRVGIQLAAYSSALLLNSAIQNSLNPNNKVNLTDPSKPDFLKFKFGSLTIDPTSGLSSTARFIGDIGSFPFKDQKSLHGDDEIQSAGKKSATYIRGKLSPFYSFLGDLYTRTDYNHNVLPFSHKKSAKYAHKLTYPEYLSQRLPLPIAEALHVMYESAHEHGGNKVLAKDIMTGIITGGISGGTGFRVNDYGKKPTKHTQEN